MQKKSIIYYRIKNPLIKENLLRIEEKNKFFFLLRKNSYNQKEKYPKRIFLQHFSLEKLLIKEILFCV
jgi:hypothetical protein